MRDRRVSCLPRWTVCPTRSPSLGPNRSTCRGECSWSGPLVTPPGRCHRGPLTNGPGRIPPYCVCSGGADTVTGGGPKPLRLGPSPAFPVGCFRPAPPFAVWFVVVGFPFSPGWGGLAVVGGGSSPLLAVLLVCVSPPLLAEARLSAAVVAVSAGYGGGFPVLCVFVARRVLVCASCVCGGGVGVGVSAVYAGECVVCGGWFPWLGLAGGVGVGVAGVCCGWSVATPGGRS